MGELISQTQDGETYRPDGSVIMISRLDFSKALNNNQGGSEQGYMPENSAHPSAFNDHQQNHSSQEFKKP